MSYPYILRPAKFTVIEKVAAEFAAIIYETGRAQGMTSKYKNPRAYAKAHLEKFIPVAIKHLTDMLGRQDLPTLMKDEIYDALMERTNDPVLKQYITEKTPSPMAPPSDMRISKGDMDDEEIQNSMIGVNPAMQINWGEGGNPFENYKKSKGH